MAEQKKKANPMLRIALRTDKQKKKTLIKGKSRSRSADLSGKESENLRMKPTRPGTAKKTKRTYQSDTVLASLSAGLGLPPLKMVLVHAQNDRANAATRPMTKSKPARSEQEAVMKIIEHLTKSQ